MEGRYALIIRDIYTGIIMAYPTARRDTDSVVRAIKHFCGRRKIKQVYSDDGPELINACVELKLNHDLSLPGRPQNNSLAERTNQFIIDQTSACLVHAGLPTCYWVQAITTLCHLMNIEEVNGSSAWMRLHGEEFKGEKIPFGALVDFKPSEARGGKREKFEPRGETGIFAGYVLSTGMHWANKYRAWALTAFAGAELNIKKAKVPPRLRMPHQTERMILKSPLTFPIQQKYKVANETLEGIEMSIDAIGLDARDRLIEDEDYEPELLQSDEKRLLDDEVDQIAGLLLDDGPEVIVGDRGDHAGDEDVRPSSSKGKGDGYSKGDEKVAKSDLPHVSVGLPGDGITYVNDDGKEVKIDKAGRPYPVGKDGFRLMKTSRPPEFTPEEWKMMSKYYTKEEKAEVRAVAKGKRKIPRVKSLRFPRRQRHGHYRCPVVREFERCFGTAGVE